MDYCNGGNLADYSRNKEFSEKEIWEFIQQFINGMRQMFLTFTIPFFIFLKRQVQKFLSNNFLSKLSLMKDMTIASILCSFAVVGEQASLSIWQQIN